MASYRNHVCIFAVVTIGLLAGLMLGVAIEQETAQELLPDCWIVRQNLNDQVFRKMMPASFAVILVSTIFATFLCRGSARKWMAGAALSSIVVIAITVVLEVPLNDLISQWNSHNVPYDWRATRDAWLWNHWLRTWFGALAFLLSVTALGATSDARRDLSKQARANASSSLSQ